ncbi:hypothetical protein [Streptomyces naphthomycinicus]|uniref:hypothetical protein n=1 Tax=Streptomyces naphthomycinicus TaxID=2872625 RepID=UPI001CEDA0CC|nr:hypothetical protein [Streptomyces sp. TML10]
MSTAIAIAIATAAVAVAVVVVAFRVRRAWAAATAKVDAALAAARDAGPSRDTTALAECERIWTLPAHDAGLDQLRQTIRDEQEKGD